MFMLDRYYIECKRFCPLGGLLKILTFLESNVNFETYFRELSPTNSISLATGYNEG